MPQTVTTGYFPASGNTENATKDPLILYSYPVTQGHDEFYPMDTVTHYDCIADNHTVQPDLEPIIKRTRRGRDPNGPRQRTSAYSYWRKYQNENGHKQPAKKSKELWAGLSNDVKAPFEDMADRDDRRYQVQMKAYTLSKKISDYVDHVLG